MHFSDRLAAVIKQKNSCLMLGLDPNWEKLPAHLKTGDSLQEKADIFEAFCCDMVDTCASEVCGIKIQMGYFEALGSVGVKAVENLIAHTRQNHPELIIMMDAKRGDIGSTSEAYAQAFFGDTGLSGDAVTVNPFLGADGLNPFYNYGPEKSSFVLVKTSNPSGSQYQADIYEAIAQDVEKAGQKSENGWSHLGAVVGATNGEEITRARELMPSTWILAPGVGAQGGKIEDVLSVRDKEGLGVLIPVSRSVLYASNGEDYLEASQAEIKSLWESQKL